MFEHYGIKEAILWDGSRESEKKILKIYPKAKIFNDSFNRGPLKPFRLEKVVVLVDKFNCQVVVHTDDYIVFRFDGTTSTCRKKTFEESYKPLNELRNEKIDSLFKKKWFKLF